MKIIKIKFLCYWQKILFFGCILCLCSFSFANNTDPATSRIKWIRMPNGSPYNIATNGDYQLDNQIYTFAHDANFNLSINVYNNDGTVNTVVQITDTEFKEMFDRAFGIINQATGSNFMRATDSESRAIIINITDPTVFPAYAYTFPPLEPWGAFLYPHLTPAQQAAYNQLHHSGGILFFRNEIQTGDFLYRSIFTYFINTGVIPPNTTLNQYVRWRLNFIILHEAYHLFGAVHGTMIEGIPLEQVNQVEIIAGDGEMLYPPTADGINFMPSIMTETAIPWLGASQVGDNYFYALSRFHNGPVTDQNMGLARQDTNIIACANLYYPESVSIEGKRATNTNVLCSITPTISVNYINGVTYLMKTIITELGYPILYPLYISK